MKRSIKIAESLGPNDPGLAHPLTFLGNALTERGALDEALPPLRRALALREAQPGDPAELAETRYAVAQALWPQASERSGARELARQASEGYTSAGSAYTDDVRQVESWLIEHVL